MQRIFFQPKGDTCFSTVIGGTVITALEKKWKWSGGATDVANNSWIGSGQASSADIIDACCYYAKAIHMKH